MPKKINTDDLFRATVQLFAQNGYLATTTQEIAKLAGINETTLYRRYDNKATLISKALHHCLAQSPFAYLNATNDIRTDLIAIVIAYEKTFQAFGGAVMTLMIEMPRHKELQTASAALMPNILSATGIIAYHQKSGALKSGNPTLLLSALISPIITSNMLAKSTANFDLPKISAEQLVDRFLQGYHMNA